MTPQASKTAARLSSCYWRKSASKNLPQKSWSFSERGYYGQFCSFFRFPPTTRISAAANHKSVLVDFLLRGLYDPSQIAGAILLPTRSSPVQGTSVAPKEVLGWYTKGLAQRIAGDLVPGLGSSKHLPRDAVVAARKLYEGVVVHQRQKAKRGAMTTLRLPNWTMKISAKSPVRCSRIFDYAVRSALKISMAKT